MGGRVLYQDSQRRDQLELNPSAVTLIGRGFDCAIRTDDHMVSRVHAEIRLENGRYVVEDKGSSNGTLVNGARIQKQILNNNDVVQCGTLWLQYTEELPLVPPHMAGQAPGGDPPGKKGGTIRLDMAPGGGGASPGGGAATGAGPGLPYAATGYAPGTGGPGPGGGAATGGGYGSSPGGYPPAGGQPRGPAPYGNPPQMPGGGQYGSPPPMPGGGYAQPGGGPPGAGSAFGTPAGAVGGSAFGQPGSAFGAPGGGAPGGSAFGNPPPMPGQGNQGGGSAFGSPPPMPGQGAPGGGQGFGNPPPMPGGNPAIFARGSGAPGEPSVVVNLAEGQDGGKLAVEVQRLRTDNEQLQSNYDREVADGKRIRAEAATLRDRIEELRITIKDREEQVGAHGRVADELRDEVNQTREQLSRAKQEEIQLNEQIAARDRQLSRSQDDITKLKDDIEESSRKLVDLSRAKDEDFKKHNDLLAEIEHLREVNNDQQRMLEENRVGMISQEEVIKGLRTDREKLQRQTAQFKAERDETVTSASRLEAHTKALEEENKRLTRLLVENQTGSSGGGDAVARLTGELKDLRVELRKLESDRDRLQQQYERSDADVQRLEGHTAQLEVELQEANHAKMSAESVRAVAEEALARAEVARHKAAEEALTASRARDQATSGDADTRREVDRLRKKVTELEAKAAAPQTGPDPKALEAEIEALGRKVKDAVDRASTAERSMKALQAELDAAKTDAKQARAEAERARAAGGSASDSAPAPESGDLLGQVRELYETLNEHFSALKNNLGLVENELGNLGGGNPDAVRTIGETVETLVGNAEDAKGALRNLRDLVEPPG